MDRRKEKVVTKNVEIKSVKVAIGDTEHELTLGQARALRDALMELFPEPARVRDTYPVPVPYPVPRPVPVWPRDRWVTIWGSGDTTGRVQGLFDRDNGTAKLSVS